MKPNANKNFVRDSHFVRLDTAPKATDPAPIRPSYSEVLTPPVQNKPNAAAVSHTRAALANKINKRKPVLVSGSKPASDTSKTSQAANAAIKQNTTTADESFSSVKRVAITISKRQRVSKETKPPERSAERLGTEPNLTKNIRETVSKLAVEFITDTPVGTSPPSTIFHEAFAVPSPVDVVDKLSQDDETDAPYKLGAILSFSEVNQDKTDAAGKPVATSIKDAVNVPESKLETCGIAKKLSSPILDTTGILEEKKGVPGIVKRAWRSKKG
ncbi:uncharacterized protein EKO05_0004244 [Ascochyta rabiei]|uniref:uncharacterized protein n=1 Tax=Didymella rabiei TaxID=5454 RepID=UPI0021FDD081|nr:uncharacterized protein EKO05_0004244 [Ascochyta rabiei]UPX13745.1 hypothetical protein EKO05_0004244 [Ascochyta rabiei]